MAETARRAERSGRTRAAIVDALRDADGPLRVEEVAAAIGLQVSGTRWQLDHLVGAGVVRRSTTRPASRGRPAVLYSAAPAAEVNEVEPYRMLARLLAAELDRSKGDATITPAEAAGRVWGEAAGIGDAGVREAVLRLLDETGFRPRPGADSGDIEIGQCPFFDIASAHPAVVCSVHAGLLRGAVQRLNADPEDVALLPVLTPDKPCRVVVKAAGAG